MSKTSILHQKRLSCLLKRLSLFSWTGTKGVILFYYYFFFLAAEASYDNSVQWCVLDRFEMVLSASALRNNLFQSVIMLKNANF